jgi:hypothetical protein
VEDAGKRAVEAARKIAGEVQRSHDLEPVVEGLVEAMRDAARDYVDAHPQLTTEDCCIAVQSVWGLVEQDMLERQGNEEP